MKHLSVRLWLVVAALSGLASDSFAVEILTDDFNYSGALTNNGWSAYSGADGSVTSDTTRAYVGGGAEDIRLQFADQGTEPTFASFTLNVASLPSSGSEYSFGFIDASTMEARFGISVTGGGTSYRLTAYGGGNSILSTDDTDLQLNTDYSIAIYSDGTNSHRLWVDANTGSFDFPDLQATGASSGLDGFFLRQGTALDNGAASWTVADLVIGTEFTNVVSGAPTITTNVRFSLSSVLVIETNGAYEVTIQKNLPEGTVSGEIVIGGTATLGDDYTVSPTNFTLDGAVTSATITITVIDDSDVEPDLETAILTLANLTGGIAAVPSTFTLTIFNDDEPALPAGGPVWINELDYDNVGTDSNEFVEIAGPAGTDLSVYSVVLYNATDRKVYQTDALSGIIDDEGCGYGAIAYYFGVTDAIQNGPDAIALVSNGVTVIEFLSYEGAFSANDGPAVGLISVDIGVDDGNSLEGNPQRSGSGDTAGDFTWEFADLSPGDLNLNQTITPCGAEVVLDEYDIEEISVVGTTLSAVLYVTSNGVPYSLLYTTNLMNGLVPTGTADTQIATGGPLGLDDTNLVDEARIYWIRTNDDPVPP